MKEEKLRRLARKDIRLFNHLCFKDEQRVPWATTGFQVKWHELMDKHPRLVIFAPIEHGKSEQIIRARLLRDLGKNPDLRCAIICNTQSQAMKYLGEIKEDIEMNKNLISIYPNLRPEARAGKYQKWTDSAIIVERDITSKDHSIQALGVHGAVMGSRLDRIYIDDPNDFENSLTTDQRKKVVQWILTTLLGRLTKNGRCVVDMNAWHDDDVGHILAKNHDFVDVTYKATGDDGKILWPEQWPAERLADKKRELGEIEYGRQLQNETLSDTMSIFKRVWFEKCLERGREYMLVDSYPHTDLRLITGVDPAVKKGEEHDLTVFFTIGLDSAGNRRILNIYSKRMEFPEIIRTILEKNEAFPRTAFIIEDNAAQAYLVQYLRSLPEEAKAQYPHAGSIRIKGLTTTGQRKADPQIGVRSMAIDFENGKWIIPKGEETRLWMQEFIAWSPQSHTGDRVMASWLADMEAGKPRGDVVHVGTGKQPQKQEKGEPAMAGAVSQVDDELHEERVWQGV